MLPTQVPGFRCTCLRGLVIYRRFITREKYVLNISVQLLVNLKDFYSIYLLNWVIIRVNGLCLHLKREIYFR